MGGRTARRIGDEDGMLERLFHPETLKLLGVHAIGDRAAEIIRIGQAVITLGRIEYFHDTVFNYPTLADAYKVAPPDGLNEL
jgi:NAD(P) transhydrogenase